MNNKYANPDNWIKALKEAYSTYHSITGPIMVNNELSYYIYDKKMTKEEWEMHPEVIEYKKRVIKEILNG